MLQLVKWYALYTQNLFEMEQNGDMYSRKTCLWFFFGGRVLTFKWKVVLPNTTSDETNVCFTDKISVALHYKKTEGLRRLLRSRTIVCLKPKGHVRVGSRIIFRPAKIIQPCIIRALCALLHSNNINLIWYHPTNVIRDLCCEMKRWGRAALGHCFCHAMCQT